MTEYTEAIVLHLSRHTDKAYILHTYTLQHGRMQYLVYGVHSKKQQTPAAALESFSLIGIEAHYPASSDALPTLKQAHLLFTPKNRPADIRRQTIAIFLAEVLYRSLRLPMEDPQLFRYLSQTVSLLDSSPAPENLHLIFMLQFAHYMGFSPTLDETDTNDPSFDFLSANENFFTPDENKLLLNLEYNNALPVTRKMRQQLLHQLCRYYELHIDGFQTPKSLDILEEIFDE